MMEKEEITDTDRQNVRMMLTLDWAQSYFKMIRNEIYEIEILERHGLKISEDPLTEDFRYKLGKKEGLMIALEKPQECEKLFLRKPK